VHWSVDNPGIVQILDNGLFKAVAAEGTARITATTRDGGFTAFCDVTVVAGYNKVTVFTVTATGADGNPFSLPTANVDVRPDILAGTVFTISVACNDDAAFPGANFSIRNNNSRASATQDGVITVTETGTTTGPFSVLVTPKDTSVKFNAAGEVDSAGAYTQLEYRFNRTEAPVVVDPGTVHVENLYVSASTFSGKYESKATADSPADIASAPTVSGMTQVNGATTKDSGPYYVARIGDEFTVTVTIDEGDTVYNTIIVGSSNSRVSVYNGTEWKSGTANPVTITGVVVDGKLEFTLRLKITGAEQCQLDIKSSDPAWAGGNVSSGVLRYNFYGVAADAWTTE
jgi:hypothetical protein